MVSFFFNIRCYNKMTDKADDGSAKGAKMQNLEAKMKAAIPVRKRIAMFNLFNREDWNSAMKLQ